jgi:C1A family cysteine protease
MSDFIRQGSGWHPDLPDFRDYSPFSEPIIDLFRDARLAAGETPLYADLREFFSPVPEKHHRSTAQACVALIEYFHRRAKGQRLEPSAPFLHYVATRIGGQIGLPGMDLRSHLRAMVKFGIPPRSLWLDDSDQDPASDPVLYSFHEPYGGIRYFRLDGLNQRGCETLRVVKSFLSAGFPSVFGFSVPGSLSIDASIPYRPTLDSVRGGQALVAVGFDDNRLRNTKGALLVRGCWGASWGENGYGWLPYAYAEKQLATCFWTFVHREWIESGEFDRPHVVAER